MADVTITDRITEQVGHLPPGLQRRVLDFVEALAQSRPKGEPGAHLLRFAGSLDPQSAQEMRSAIEEGCDAAPPNAPWPHASPRGCGQEGNLFPTTTSGSRRSPASTVWRSSPVTSTSMRSRV